jgi:hypothetical protein
LTGEVTLRKLAGMTRFISIDPPSRHPCIGPQVISLVIAKTVKPG